MNLFRKQILCVGPKVAVDKQLQIRIAGMHPQWTVRFSGGSQEGLALLKENAFDAVVVDMQLSDGDGLQLLNKVQERHPGIHRMVVSDLSHRDAALQCAGAAHHCVPKPWDSETLRPALERAFSLNVWLSNPAVRELAGRMVTVPSAPKLYFEVSRALQSEDAGLGEIANLIATDPAMTAKLLHLSNSALLGLRQKVTNVHDAISYLGLETTRSLILLAHTFSYCDRTKTAGFNIEGLWEHSLASGLLAKKIASVAGGTEEIIEESFLAGLLHDIGKLLFAVNLGFDYGGVIARARQGNITLWEAETERYQATHAEIGAQILADWNLPLGIVEAVALHHHPTKLLAPGFCPLTAVHVADALEHEFSDGYQPVEARFIDQNYIADLGLAEKIEGWRQTCREELQIANTESQA
jgi:putative nucleotidyltransferase with HDIG domain